MMCSYKYKYNNQSINYSKSHAAILCCTELPDGRAQRQQVIN